MRSLFRPTALTFHRAVYIASLVACFSFILFNVLDVDGSNFPLRQPQAATFAAEPEGSENIDHICADGFADFCHALPAIVRADQNR